MTDNEIIKALECCIGQEGNCDICPLHSRTCVDDLLRFALNLINHQNAEVERLQIKIEGVQEANAILREHIKKAVKEFAERLKEHTRKMSSSDFSGEFWDKAVLVRDIDNLVKEMAGDAE